MTTPRSLLAGGVHWKCGTVGISWWTNSVMMYVPLFSWRNMTFRWNSKRKQKSPSENSMMITTSPALGAMSSMHESSSSHSEQTDQPPKLSWDVRHFNSPLRKENPRIWSSCVVAGRNGEVYEFGGLVAPYTYTNLLTIIDTGLIGPDKTTDKISEYDWKCAHCCWRTKSDSVGSMCPRRGYISE